MQAPQRAPKQPLVRLRQGATELSGPGFDGSLLYPNDDDLTRQVDGGEAAGQRIVVTGRILDENGAPIPNARWKSGNATAPAAATTSRDYRIAASSPRKCLLWRRGKPLRSKDEG